MKLLTSFEVPTNEERRKLAIFHLGVTSIPKLSQITGKDRLGVRGVLHQRVISVTKWHYRNNIAKNLIKQVLRKKPKKKALEKLKRIWIRS